MSDAPPAKKAAPRKDAAKAAGPPPETAPNDGPTPPDLSVYPHLGVDRLQIGEVPNVVQVVAAVKAEVGAIGKNRKMDAPGSPKYAFRSIDDIVDAAHGPMSRHGLIVVPHAITDASSSEVQFRNSTGVARLIRVQFRAYGPAGDHLELEAQGEANDTSDKASNKAHTAAWKIALTQLLAIPYQDLEEQDDTRLERADRPRQQSQGSQQRRPAPTSNGQAGGAAPPPAPGAELSDAGWEALKRKLAEVKAANPNNIDALIKWAKLNTGSASLDRSTMTMERYNAVLKEASAMLRGSGTAGRQPAAEGQQQAPATPPARKPTPAEQLAADVRKELKAQLAALSEPMQTIVGQEIEQATGAFGPPLEVFDQIPAGDDWDAWITGVVHEAIDADALTGGEDPGY
jgi:hypothetical protein